MNILLLEPTYTAKFPPLGLMKIASYHKHCRGDFVWFAKGQPPAQVSENVRSKLLNDLIAVLKTLDEDALGNLLGIAKKMRKG
ncbi:MAG: hypothetical protein FWC27_03805 [Firmicutes bacterium]|nr:hypothetical protein [Bacillota bacterium]